MKNFLCTRYGTLLGIVTVVIWTITLLITQGFEDLSRFLFPISAALLQFNYKPQPCPIWLWYAGGILHWTFSGAFLDLLRLIFRKQSQNERTGIMIAGVLAIIFVCSQFANIASSDIYSPNGALVAKAEVSSGFVELVVYDTRLKKELLIETRASDYQKWALDWAPGNILVFYSSDIGTSSYDIINGSTKQRTPTSKEVEVGETAYQAKYGKKPNASH